MGTHGIYGSEAVRSERHHEARAGARRDGDRCGVFRRAVACGRPCCGSADCDRLDHSPSVSVSLPAISMTVSTPVSTTVVSTPTVSTTVSTPAVSTTVSTPTVSATVSVPTSGTSVTAPTAATTIAAPAATRPPSTVAGTTTSASTSSSPTGASAGAAASHPGGQRRSTGPGAGSILRSFGGPGAPFADSPIPAPSSAGGQSFGAASPHGTSGLRPALSPKASDSVRPHLGKLAVRLSFVLSAPARVTFMVFGPGRDCDLVGWFTVAAHRRLNQCPSEVTPKNQLNPGLYQLVPRAQSKAVDSLPRMRIIVDRRGVRPSGPAGWRNCGHAVPGSVSAPAACCFASLASTQRCCRDYSIQAARLAERANNRGWARPVACRGPPLGADSGLLRDALLVGLLSLSLMLLGVARFRLSPGIGGYRAARKRATVKRSMLGARTVGARGDPLLL